MAKYPGVGTLVEIDFSGASTTWEAVGCVREYTPPPQTRTPIDATCLTDTSVDTIVGQEEQSDFSFTEIWDPMGTVAAKIDTAYAGRDLINVRLTWTDGTNTATETFDGQILSLTPTTVGADGVLEREVMIVRKSDPAYATPP